MRKIEPRDLENKTITKVLCECDNVIHLHLSDGTVLAVWAEVEGPYKLPVVRVDDQCY